MTFDFQWTIGHSSISESYTISVPIYDDLIYIGQFCQLDLNPLEKDDRPFHWTTPKEFIQVCNSQLKTFPLNNTSSSEVYRHIESTIIAIINRIIKHDFIRFESLLLELDVLCHILKCRKYKASRLPELYNSLLVVIIEQYEDAIRIGKNDQRLRYSNILAEINDSKGM